MKLLPYWVMGALAVASLVLAVIGGGAWWILPAIVWAVVALYAVFDRRMKRREGPAERLAADPDPHL